MTLAHRAPAPALLQRASSGLRRHAAAAAVFAIVAVVITWPLAIHLGDALPGTGLDDNVGFLWDFWLLRRALANELAVIVREGLELEQLHVVVEASG